jgi:mannan endo-1,4-beta-mannosidase
MTKPPKSAFGGFVTAEHGMLLEGGKPFRFISFNVPNLNYVEDDMSFARSNPYRLPAEFEMRDAFATVSEMGGRALRIYTIPVKSAGFPPDAPTYVMGPGLFSEEAFRCLDLMMALAGEYGVRVIVPLVNNWQWMGGRPSYAAFRGMSQNDFWTDSLLIDDFKATIRYLLERTNTVTGVKYKDDKAILCWETGNELFAPFEWTVEIARFIKSIDVNHLVMDGSRGDYSNQTPSVQPGALAEPAIDIVTTHHYEIDTAAVPRHIEDNIRAIGGRKVYLVGGFGFASTATVEAVLDMIVEHPHDIAGALIWSLRFHNRDGGFYWHTEPLGGIYKALHWPGFPSGQTYDEARMMMVIRRKAFEIRNLPPPPVSPAEPPVLLPVETADAITWQGSMGAASYVVERAAAPEGPWERICPSVADADIPNFPLYNDTSAKVGGRYYYRVLAVNSTGVSPPSNVVGPVTVAFKTKIDTMKNLDEMVYSNMVSPVTGNDRSYKEIRNRLAGKAGSELVYSVPGKFRSFTIYAFEQAAHGMLQIHGSNDGHSWRNLGVVPKNYSSVETNYDYWRPKLYRYEGGEPMQFVRIKFKGVAQLARAEITYTNR